MTSNKIKLTIGSLLHDIGKVLYRADDGRNHCVSGYDYLKEIPGFDDPEILQCVKYHHSNMIYNMDKRPEHALFYITYIADNIAAFADRRKSDSGEKGFVREIPLDSIFNVLNGNHETMVYPPAFLSQKPEMPRENAGISYPEEYYRKVLEQVRSCLAGIEMNGSYVNSLLEVLEANLSFIPSSTNRGELADISLFDHCKMTAALAACILDYAEDQRVTDYETAFYRETEKFYQKKVFMLYSMDISGIQDFIYTISSKGALKGLRSRSFYLDMVLQHAIDELLEKLELSRANLLYLGGGHAYLLLPNTLGCRDCIREFERDLNQWFMENVDISLYIAGGFSACSANQLRNQPDGSYAEIFREVSEAISVKKRHRYAADQIRYLNRDRDADYERECVICRRTDRLDQEGKCSICGGLERLSEGIIHGKFFSVLKKRESEKQGMPLPYNQYLIADTERELIARMKNRESYVRSYCKNDWYTGYQMVSKLWIGDYVSSSSFKELADQSHGIRRIAVFRADVDNLGKAFVEGFSAEQNTISRTSTFSRKLSAFFKYHINELLNHGRYHLDGSDELRPRNAAIIYSGGDDMFVVGAWDDILGFAIDLYRQFQEFTQGTLTLSAGIGIYHDSYPIAAMARECGELEECSKQMEGKNACTVFAEGQTYHWDQLIQSVLGEKYLLLQEFLNSQPDFGNSLLYRMLELIRMRKQEDRLNIARFAYTLARLDPGEDAGEEQKRRYREFSRKLYRWIQEEEDCRELITAITIYVYYHRGEEQI